MNALYNQPNYSFLSLVFAFLLRGGTAVSQPPIQVTNVSEINTAFQEYSPQFYKDGIVFIASNPFVKLPKREDDQTGKTTTSIFFSRKNTAEKHLLPTPFAEELTSEYYDGPLSFNYDGSKLYFTKTKVKNGLPVVDKDGIVHLQIYTADKQGSKWVNMREMPFCDAKYDYVHPSVTPDGKKLYFASNKPGGFGGLDLYVSYLIDNQWSDPVNLGDRINTNGNEMFPFIASNGTLFFSTNGRKGFGNLDLYFTVKKDTGWVMPSILPQPINSHSDDFGLITNDDLSFGYFSSNRATGKGDDDIFKFYAPYGILHESLYAIEEEEIIEDSATDISATSTNLRVSELAPLSTIPFLLTEKLAPVMSMFSDSALPIHAELVSIKLPIEPAATEVVVAAKSVAEPAPIEKEEAKTTTAPTKPTPSVIAPIISGSSKKSDGKKYLVVVGTYASEKNAKEQLQKVINKGYKETIIIHYDDTRLYGVCVKSTADEKEAQLLARSIKEQSEIDAFVKVLK